MTRLPLRYLLPLANRHILNGRRTNPRRRERRGVLLLALVLNQYCGKPGEIHFVFSCVGECT